MALAPARPTGGGDCLRGAVLHHGDGLSVVAPTRPISKASTPSRERSPHGSLAEGGRRARRQDASASSAPARRESRRFPSSPSRPRDLYVFQRTANYSMAGSQPPLIRTNRQAVTKAGYAGFRERQQADESSGFEASHCTAGSALQFPCRRVDKSLEHEPKPRCSALGGFGFLGRCGTTFLRRPQGANELAAAMFVREHGSARRSTTRRPQRRAVSARLGPLGCKRLGASTLGYFETFNRDNVTPRRSCAEPHREDHGRPADRDRVVVTSSST